MDQQTNQERAQPSQPENPEVWVIGQGFDGLEFVRGRAGAYWLQGQADEKPIGLFLLKADESENHWDGGPCLGRSEWSGIFADILYELSDEAEQTIGVIVAELTRAYPQATVSPFVFSDIIDGSVDGDYTPTVKAAREIHEERQVQEAAQDLGDALDAEQPGAPAQPPEDPQQLYGRIREQLPDLMPDKDLADLLRAKGVKKLSDLKSLGIRLGFGFEERREKKPRLIEVQPRENEMADQGGNSGAARD